MNWIELVKKHWPNISDEGADHLLWNVTCFPMGSAELVEQQLIEAFNSSNGNIDLAVELVMQELDEEFAKHQTWTKLQEDHG
jgi:hypothetical protein